MNPFSFDNFFRRRRQQRRRNAEIANSFITEAITVDAIVDDEPPRRRQNVERLRESRGHNLMEDYFIERPIFDEQAFRRRYRMSMNLFNRILTDLCNHDNFWRQRSDATGLVGLLPQQKMTAALRMLAYGSAADQCAEITRMGESTTLECMKKWCIQVYELYGDIYLRAPNAADITRLLRMGKHRGFPGMIGSIDCMHWEWKNCPTAWQGAFSGRKKRPTIILEAVASYDTWIWHSFFGVPGAQNDINVLHQSDIFDSLLAGMSPNVRYKVNGMTYHNTYYLADGIYPRYSSFVKTISNPQELPEKLFAKKQEAYRKDVERCFGILQSRWAIIRHAARCHHQSTLKNIMLACIIMHNMIVEEEFVEEEFEENVEEDLQNPSSAFTVYDGPVDEQGNRIPFEPVGRGGPYYEQRFQDRVVDLQSSYIHGELQKDLVKHNWFIETGERL